LNLAYLTLLLALGCRFVFFDMDTGRQEQWLTLTDEAADHRINDGTTDPAGRFWAGTMACENYRQRAGGSLYRVAANDRPPPCQPRLALIPL